MLVRGTGLGTPYSNYSTANILYRVQYGVRTQVILDGAFRATARELTGPSGRVLLVDTPHTLGAPLALIYFDFAKGGNL